MYCDNGDVIAGWGYVTVNCDHWMAYSKWLCFFSIFVFLIGGTALFWLNVWELFIWISDSNQRLIPFNNVLLAEFFTRYICTYRCTYFLYNLFLFKKKKISNAFKNHITLRNSIFIHTFSANKFHKIVISI